MVSSGIQIIQEHPNGSKSISFIETPSSGSHYLVCVEDDTTQDSLPVLRLDVKARGGQTLTISVAEDIQVKSSAVEAENTAGESQYVQSNGQVTVPDDGGITSTWASTPPPRHGLTVSETPLKNATFTDDGLGSVGEVAISAMQGKEGKEGNQIRPSGSTSSEALKIIGKNGQNSQSGPSSPPSQLHTKPDDSEVRSLQIPDEKPSSNPSNGSMWEVNVNRTVTANTKLPNNKTDDQITDSDSGEEEGMPSPSRKRRFVAIAVPETACGIEEEGDTILSRYPQKGLKRAKTADPNNEESQDSMRSAITLQRRPPSPNDAFATLQWDAKTQPSEPASSYGTSQPTREVSEPTSSFRSIRSAARASFASSQSPKSNMKMVLASSVSFKDSDPILKFLTGQGVKIINDIADADMLCVGKDAELKRTSNLVSAVACGKDIISDAWIYDSVREDKLLNPNDYKAKDPHREKEWGTTLNDAVDRGKRGVKALSDWSICFTPKVKSQLGKGFLELKQICLQAGAKSVRASTPKKNPQEPGTLVIASEDDKDLDLLRSNGLQPYTKELITFSILRGSLDMENDEFLIKKQEPKAQSSASRMRKR